MQQYKTLNILGTEANPLVTMENVFGDITLAFNFNKVADEAGSEISNPFKGTYTIKIFDIADKIKNKIDDENLCVQLDGYNGTITKMENAKLNYDEDENDVMFLSKRCTKIFK